MLLKINWDYGSSILGPNDTMSFAVGYLHWLLPLMIIVLLPFIARLKRQAALILFSLFTFLFSLFMMHWKATPIWQAISPLAYLQFPWRFLTLSIFIGSFLSGAVILIFPKNSLPAKALAAGGLTLLLLLNANYFRPREWLTNINDTNKFTGHDWLWQVTGSIFDYLPIWAPRPPATGQEEYLKFVSGSGVYKINDFKTNLQKYTVEASSSATLELQTYYFPGWRLWSDGLEVNIDPSRDPLLGRMQVDLDQGEHRLIAKFTNTPVRFVADSLSLIAWALLILYFVPWPNLTKRADYTKV